MPQLEPGESRTAIAPIVAKPSGVDCEAELFLGPDDTTKVVSSGRVPFVSTGSTKNVNLPVTMPGAPGTYHGYIDVFAGGFRFLAYILKEDVVIAAPTGPLELGSVTILDINGKQFIETGIEDGIPYGVLAEPLVLSSFKWTITIHIRNNTIIFDKDNYVKFFFEFWPEPTWAAEFPYSSPPALRAWASVPMVCESPEKGCPPSVYVAIPPFETSGFFSEIFSGGYWTKGLYDGHFHYCARLFDQMLGPCFGQFNIKNLVRMTTTGEFE